MKALRSYRQLNRLLQNESYEPMLSWGLRMALAGTLPVVWGISANRLNDAAWIALTAEAISWTELKGSFNWRVRTLFLGALFAVAFSVFGIVTAGNVWLSVAGMLLTGFFATLLKNMGDRASGLALSVYLMFIITNAYPAAESAEMLHRTILICIGAGIPVALGLAVSLAMPAELPFRRQVALVWRAVAEVAGSIQAVAAQSAPGNSYEAIYLKEKELRAALDTSYQFFGKMLHQVSKKEKHEYQLSALRKSAGLISVNLVAIAEELEHARSGGTDEELLFELSRLFSALGEAIKRVSVYILNLKPEEQLLAAAHINRARNMAAVIGSRPGGDGATQRILKYADRTIKLVDNALQRAGQAGEGRRVYRSYPLIKTSFMLRPKYLANNFRSLFNTNVLTTRYALRSAIAAGAGLFFSKWFRIDHGYWIPLSVMIVQQPYFGSTLKKAVDRVVGTLLGGLAGGLLLHLPADLHVKEGILFLTFVFMVYYIRKQYAVAVFLITLNLVLLFNIEAAYNNMLMVSRALCTIGGAILTIAAGFALFPSWDRKWLPAHLADAIAGNYQYFIRTFFSDEPNLQWTRNKRNVESANSNVFDSFNRYLEEPGNEKATVYFDLIMSNIRITRNLNKIHLENDEAIAGNTATASQSAGRIRLCREHFDTVLQRLSALNPDSSYTVAGPAIQTKFFNRLNENQLVCLEKILLELRTMQGYLSQAAPAGNTN